MDHNTFLIMYAQRLEEIRQLNEMNQELADENQKLADENRALKEKLAKTEASGSIEG